MTATVVLDAGPLGLLSAPPRKAEAIECFQWLSSLVGAGVPVVIPEIADYEVRRELLRTKNTASVARLDALVQLAEYLPITTIAMRRAAEIWSQARQAGQPTAGDKTIDADVILAAQAATLATDDYIIATANVGHLSRFATAASWRDILA